MKPRQSRLTPADKAASARAKALWLQAKKANPSLTQDALAERLDITQGAVSQYLNARMAINYETAVKLAAAFGCRVEDIRDDFDVLVHQRLLVNDQRAAYVEPQAEIPIYDAAVSAGNGAANADTKKLGTLLFRPSSLARRGISIANASAVYVKGDSMLPRLRDGDTVVYDKSDATPRDGRVYVITWNGDDYVKRLRFYDGRWWISSDNKADPQWRDDKPVFPERDEFTVNGRVRWVGSWED